MKHLASRSFWEAYAKLPESVRALADKNYALLKREIRDIPPCSLRKVGLFWSVRVGAATGLWQWKSTKTWLMVLDRFARGL